MLNYKRPHTLKCSLEISETWDFSGSPVVKTSPSKTRGVGSIPGQGAKTPRGQKNQKHNVEAVL